MRVLAIVSAFLFSSGLCALVYQAVWLRAFRLIFGASTPSTAAVLAIFLGGLGLGGALLGRRAERSAFPLSLYGNLEIGVALTAAATPFLLDAAHAAYTFIGGSPALGTAGATVARIALSALVLGVPVFLMGGTLPAAARAVTLGADVQRRGLATLYGINTLGAVAGSLLATFVLLEIYGARNTLWLACLVNLAVGVLARARGRTLSRAPHIDDEIRSTMKRRRWAVLGAAFVSGFVFLLAELVWYRMAAPILGGSTYGFGVVLGCALFGMGVGGALYAFSPPRVPTAAAFAATCALEALLLLVPFAMGDELALLAHALRGWGASSFPILAVGWTVVTAVIVLPASLVAGYQFPLLLALKGSADVDVGKDSGEVYAANTLGSILGSLCGGFGILPLLGAPGTWLFAAGALLVVAVGAGLTGIRAARGSDDAPAGGAALAVSGGAIVLALLCMTAAGPGPLWRHSGIGAGRAELRINDKNDRIRAERDLARYTERESDGVESSLAFQRGLAWSLLQNGKSDGNTFGDATTQVGLALLPAILVNDVENAFIIGLGTGQSAGWLAQVPSVTRVDVAEIEPGVLDFAAMCAETNFDVMKNPKVHTTIGDGRELLALAPARYDLIVSEPSNPYRAGVSSFFSVELYEAAASRLTEDGVFSQWVQGYEIDVAGLEVVAATMARAFKHITIWEVGPRDLLFLASNAEQVVDVDRLRARLQTEPYRTWALRIVGLESAEGILALHRAGPSTLAALARAHADVVHTDDMPVLEYSFARSVGQERRPARQVIIEAAVRRDDLKPAVHGAVDWPRVERERSRIHVWNITVEAGGLPPPLSDALRTYAARDFFAAVVAFNASPTPLDAAERLMHVDAMSRVPASEAPRDILESELAALAQIGFAHDVAWVRLRAAITDKAAPDRIDELTEAAVGLARRDPWPMGRVLRGALLALRTAGGTERRVTALLEPFAGQVEDTLREDLAVDLERQLTVREPRRGCVQTWALVEPNTHWNADALAARMRCYRAHGHPLAALAEQELEIFASNAARQRLSFDAAD